MYAFQIGKKSGRISKHLNYLARAQSQSQSQTQCHACSVIITGAVEEITPLEVVSCLLSLAFETSNQNVRPKAETQSLNILDSLLNFFSDVFIDGQSHPPPIKH